MTPVYPSTCGLVKVHPCETAPPTNAHVITTAATTTRTRRCGLPELCSTTGVSQNGTPGSPAARNVLGNLTDRVRGSFTRYELDITIGAEPDAEQPPRRGAHD